MRRDLDSLWEYTCVEDSLNHANNWKLSFLLIQNDFIDIDGKLRVWALDNEEHTLKKEVL